MTRRTIASLWLLAFAALHGSDVATAQERANWHQRIASGFMGCTPTEVRVTRLEQDNGVHSWNAACRGAIFACVWIQGATAHCAEMRSR